MPWLEDVVRVADQVADWAPPDLTLERSEGFAPNVPLLQWSRNGKRLYLEPAKWAQGEQPTAVDLWSSRGPRVRFMGPSADGTWRVITSDLVEMHVNWNRQGIETLFNDLLAV